MSKQFEPKKLRYNFDFIFLTSAYLNLFCYLYTVFSIQSCDACFTDLLAAFDFPEFRMVMQLHQQVFRTFDLLGSDLEVDEIF